MVCIIKQLWSGCGLDHHWLPYLSSGPINWSEKCVCISIFPSCYSVKGPSGSTGWSLLFQGVALPSWIVANTWGGGFVSPPFLELQSAHFHDFSSQRIRKIKDKIKTETPDFPSAFGYLMGPIGERMLLVKAVSKCLFQWGPVTCMAHGNPMSRLWWESSVLSLVGACEGNQSCPWKWFPSWGLWRALVS